LPAASSAAIMPTSLLSFKISAPCDNFHASTCTARGPFASCSPCAAWACRQYGRPPADFRPQGHSRPRPGGFHFLLLSGALCRGRRDPGGGGPARRARRAWRHSRERETRDCPPSLALCPPQVAGVARLGRRRPGTRKKQLWTTAARRASFRTPINRARNTKK